MKTCLVLTVDDYNAFVSGGGGNGGPTKNASGRG